MFVFFPQMMSTENKMTLLKVCGFQPTISAEQPPYYGTYLGSFYWQCGRYYFQRKPMRLIPHASQGTVRINSDVHELLTTVPSSQEMELLSRHIRDTNAPRPTVMVRPMPDRTIMKQPCLTHADAAGRLELLRRMRHHHINN